MRNLILGLFGFMVTALIIGILKIIFRSQLDLFRNLCKIYFEEKRSHLRKMINEGTKGE